MSLVTSFRSVASNLRCLSLSSSSLFNYPSIQQPSQPKLPKNPRNAYNLYVSEKMELERRKNSSKRFNAAEIMKIASQEWKVLPEIQKRPYEQLHKQKRDAYLTAFEKLTDEQKDDLEQDKKQAQGAKQIKKLKKKLSALTSDKPKFVTSYNYFLAQEAKMQPERSLIELSKSCSAKWKTMTDAQKEPYQHKVRDMAAQLHQWKDKVVEDGRDVEIRALKRQIAEMKE